MEKSYSEILEGFRLDARAKNCEGYGCGHINSTLLVTTETGRRYILQKINNRIFRDVPALMRNIRMVTDHLHSLSDDPRCAMTIVQTCGGADFLEKDGFWRVYEYVEDSICLQAPETEADFEESARAFGEFQQKLAAFPARELAETIPNFHNTPDRYRIFREALAADPMGRAKEVRRETDFLLEREAEMSALQRMRDSGELPTRVTHNDTKLNNVLLDRDTRRALCVIDLDTVMPGLTAYDFGDSIRFGAATAAEDERDLSKVEMSLERFETFARGYVGACPGMTALETETLPLGARTITLENGMRFLTDYLDGDHYFAIHREGQNLDRCRTQLKLVADMEKKAERMAEIVRKASKY